MVNAGPPMGSPYTIVNVKSIVLVCFSLLACAAFAQIKPEEQPIQQAFVGLRAHAGLQITQTGTSQIGTTETHFKSVTTWFQDVEDGRPMAKLEMLIYLNDVESFRIVGDGTTVYAYDEQRNEYSASRYGNYAGAQPASYVNSLLASVRSVLKGQTVYPGRLVSEVYGGEGARYTSWIPGTTVENTGAIVRYVLGNPVHRSFEFAYTNVPPNVVLNSIDYFDHVDMGGATRDVNWSISVLSFDLALGDVTFTFVPPAGARSVVGVRPVTGG
jgi:outer membrane lipoprotein-sorting protein